MRLGSVLLATFAAALAACTTQPYQPSPPASTSPPAQPQPSVQTQPAPPPATVGEPQPLPAPVIREPVLSPASRALIGQAQAQLASRNYPVAASSIERALRIEPDNALLWIELGKVRQAEGNYVQAENMGRKALSRAINAPRAQSSAWALIAESYRARGKNSEAQDAQARADQLR
jgi:Tfp pilus assembly protein PilF